MVRHLSCMVQWLIVVGWFSVALANPNTIQQDSLSAVHPKDTIIEFKTYLESSQVPLNGMVIFYIELSWIDDMSRFHIAPIPTPHLTNLTMEGSGSSYKLSPLPNGAYKSVKTFTYQFRPLGMGMAYIDGLEIKYTDTVTGKSDILYSNRMMIKITEPLPENSTGMALSIIYLVLLTIFALTIIYFGIKYVQKRKGAQKRSQQSVMPIAEQYLKQLSQEIDPKGANLNEMTNRLSKIFREFLSVEFHLPAGVVAGKEICEQLAAEGVAEGDIKRLNELFEQMDMIKFGGEEITPNEFSHIYTIVEDFLVQRKQVWEAEHA